MLRHPLREWLDNTRPTKARNNAGAIIGWLVVAAVFGAYAIAF